MSTEQSIINDLFSMLKVTVKKGKLQFNGHEFSALALTKYFKTYQLPTQNMSKEQIMDFMRILSNPNLKLHIETFIAEHPELDEEGPKFKYIQGSDHITSNVLLLNTETLEPEHNLSVQSYINSLGKLKYVFEKTEHMLTKEVFDPSMTTKSEKVQLGEIEVLKINTYVPPDWYSKIDEATPQIPTTVLKFFHALIPNDQEREIVYDFIHYAMTSRAYYFLLLFSQTEGSGKSTLNNILQQLIGINNCFESGRDLLSMQYTLPLRHKKMVFVEEITMRGGDDAAALKKLTGPTLYFNGKYVKQFCDEFHASFVLTSNKYKDLYIEPSNRRFFAPKVREEKLEVRLTYDEMVHLRALPVEELTNLAKFFIERVPKTTNSEAPKLTEHFYYLCLRGRNSDIRDVYRSLSLNVLRGQHTVEYKDLKAGILGSKRRSNFPSVETIIDFFSAFKKEGEPLILSGNEANFIFLNPKFPVDKKLLNSEDEVGL